MRERANDGASDETTAGRTRPALGRTPYVLLDCLELPLLVADQDGRVLHVSPCFERRFGTPASAVRGASVAGIFDAGARELVLQALASVLADGEAARFRMRAAEEGWSALLSPIGPPGARAGAILLLTEEPRDAQLVRTAIRDAETPIEELAQVLEELLEQTGGRRAKRFAELAEEGTRALARVRRAVGDLSSALQPRAHAHAPGGPSFDVVALLRESVETLARDAAVFGVPLHPLLPDEAMNVPGDPAPLQQSLALWLRARLSRAPAPASLSIAARRIEPGGDPCVLISVAEAPAEGAGSAAPDTPEELVHLHEALQRAGGSLQTSVSTSGHRVTSLRLRLV